MAVSIRINRNTSTKNNLHLAALPDTLPADLVWHEEFGQLPLTESVPVTI